MTATETATRRPTLDPAGRSFIEVQFPVAKLSKESYKEKTAKQSQTLTALGKWWGRKPLVLVRAVILGLLLPATDDPDADRDIFLALMTMDEEGLLRRWQKAIPASVVWEHSAPRDRDALFDVSNGRATWKRGVPTEERRRAQKRAFLGMSYDDKLEYCLRPEEMNGPSPESWEKINAHLGTTARCLPELVHELGARRWGHAPRVGDAFCGGGSIPFEAARLGCDVFASDLNPVAGLLTWGALSIVGGPEEAASEARTVQEAAYRLLRLQIDEWGIEQNEEGWVADAYLYCSEVLDPNSGWRIPLAPSWVIGQGTRTVAELVPDWNHKTFALEISQGVTGDRLENARQNGTWNDGLKSPVDRSGSWIDPKSRQVISVEQLRGSAGWRRWEKTDLVPQPADVLQERLYCIRWTNPVTGERVFSAPTQADLLREKRVLELLQERLESWWGNGYIPSRAMELGVAINRPTNARGWTYWHHLFNPRQLLLGGCLAEIAELLGCTQVAKVALLLATGRVADWNSRLSRWHPNSANEKGEQTFYNPSLNTPPHNYGCRTSLSLGTTIMSDIASTPFSSVMENSRRQGVSLLDARDVETINDLWITDPGYADTVVYEELSEFFLAWYEGRIGECFPNWYSDSKRANAASGTGESFRMQLAACYTRLAEKMPPDGMQAVMFTHQDPAIWSDVGLTLWAAGLQVISAWTIATETGATGVKTGKFVQATVNLVLRKRTGNKRGDLSDLFPEIQEEVRRQIEEMQNLDDLRDPNFGDADLQLAAYAAALRVLTSYAEIDEIDVQHELRRVRARGEESPLARLIRQAVRIASDYLVPKGLAPATWRALTPEERLYLKGIETEASGEAREGVYQELARGYGAGPHRELYANRAANRVRFKTPSEFGSRDLRRVGEEGFAGSTLRQLLLAIASVTAHAERDPRPARVSLRAALPNYWTDRERLADLLIWLSDRADTLPHWRADAESARLLVNSLRNDNI